MFSKAFNKIFRTKKAAEDYATWQSKLDQNGNMREAYYQFMKDKLLSNSFIDDYDLINDELEKDTILKFTTIDKIKDILYAGDKYPHLEIIKEITGPTDSYSNRYATKEYNNSVYYDNWYIGNLIAEEKFYNGGHHGVVIKFEQVCLTKRRLDQIIDYLFNLSVKTKIDKFDKADFNERMKTVLGIGYSINRSDHYDVPRQMNSVMYTKANEKAVEALQSQLQNQTLVSKSDKQLIATIEITKTEELVDILNDYGKMCSEFFKNMLTYYEKFTHKLYDDRQDYIRAKENLSNEYQAKIDSIQNKIKKYVAITSIAKEDCND